MKLDEKKLEASIDAGLGLPAEWYVSDEIFELETELIFERSWQCVGLASDLSHPGDYITATIGRVPVVVLRDAGGSLRGYVNVCLHRCSVIAVGSGNSSRLQCPYHAWTYDLDGRLVSAPRSDREESFDCSDFRLADVRVECLGPLVFANLDTDTISLEEQLDGLEARVAADGMVFDGLEHVRHWESEAAANWKVLVENFNECYHCPNAHPSFSRLLSVNPDQYVLETSRWTSRAVTPLRKYPEGAAPKYPYDPTGENDKGQFALFWPTFTLNQSPGPRRIVAFWFVPVAPDLTRLVSETFVDPTASAEQIELMAKFSSSVAEEDRHLVESVQRGMRSGRVPRPRLMVDSERLVQHFDQLVVQALGRPG